MLMESSAVGVHPLADDGRGPELATVGVSAELEAHLVCRCFVNRFRPMGQEQELPLWVSTSQGFPQIGPVQVVESTCDLVGDSSEIKGCS